MNNDHHSEGATAETTLPRAAVSPANHTAPEGAAARPRSGGNVPLALRMRRWEFIRLAAPVAKIDDIAEALGMARSGVCYVLKSHGWTGRVPGKVSMPLSGVREAWRRFQAGEPISTNLLYWEDAPACRKEVHWTTSEDNLLIELLGEISLAEIAKRMGRTRLSIRSRVTRLGYDGSAWVGRNASQLAKALQAKGEYASPQCVHRWVTLGKLRSYRDKRHVVIHADDYEWMLHNWKRGMPIPQYPGMDDEERAAYVPPARMKQREYERRYKARQRAEKRNPGYMEVAA